MAKGLEDTPERGGHGSKEEFGHVPVLLKEAIDFLAVQHGGTYIDCTVGLGGHSYEIAKRLGAPGRLIGFDKDPEALERARARLRVSGLNPESPEDWPVIELIHGSFASLADDPGPKIEGGVDGILADLGVSSLQFSDPARGFSFQAEGPLDMRMNPHSELTAEQVVNQFDER